MNISLKGGRPFRYVFERNRLISAGLKPILSHTEKSCIVSYYKQFFTNNKKIIILIPVELALVIILKFLLFFPRKAVYILMR